MYWRNLILNKLDHAIFRLLVEAEIPPVDYLMDIGCGNHPVDFIKVNKGHYLIDPVKSTPTNTHQICLKGTWLDAIQYLKGHNHVHAKKCAVALIDVIEHLEKTEAVRLLKETETLSERIIVFTPWGFLDQNDGEWNTHRSGWYEHDFREGWTIHVFEHYHWCDFKGTVYDEPKPAMLAIYKK